MMIMSSLIPVRNCESARVSHVLSRHGQAVAGSRQASHLSPDRRVRHRLDVVDLERSDNSRDFCRRWIKYSDVGVEGGHRVLVVVVGGLVGEELLGGLRVSLK